MAFQYSFQVMPRTGVPSYHTIGIPLITQATVEASEVPLLATVQAQMQVYYS